MLVLLAAAMIFTPASKPIDYAVMVHGAGGGGWEYDKWRPVFEKAGWVVIAKDLAPARGGLSKTSLADYVRQVTEWGLLENRKRLVLVGASMGGILALKAAEALQPEAIVLVDSVPPAGIRSGKPRTFPKVVKWANGPLKDTRDSMPDSDEKTIQWAWKKWRDESGAVMRELSAGVTVAKPKCPVLVVIGGNDADIPPAEGKKMAKLFGADVKEYKGMSHVGPLLSTKAEVVAQDTADWLKKHPAR